jgi:hypothetical protein
MFCRSLFVLFSSFILFIILSVLLWFTDSDYLQTFHRHVLPEIDKCHMKCLTFFSSVDVRPQTSLNLSLKTNMEREQELPTLPERVTWSLVLCVCFIDRCLSFCPLYFGHYVVCSSLIYRFWLPLWYLQTLLMMELLDLYVLKWWSGRRVCCTTRAENHLRVNKDSDDYVFFLLNNKINWRKQTTKQECM